MHSDREYGPPIFFILIVIFIVCVATVTPARLILMARIDELKTRLFFMTNHPGESVFIPVEARTATANALVPLTALATHTPTPSPTPTQPTSTPRPEDTEVPTATPSPTPAPTETPYPLPSSYRIEGIKYETQHGIWNYCAPTNLSMALTYWGWQGDRTVTGKALKPFDKDKNVMPSEMIEYVQSETGYRAILRTAGTDELIKKLIVNDFPVLIEKGAFMHEVDGTLSWMGHFNVVSGYDDLKRQWIVQDSYYEADWRVDYTQLAEEWISFNNAFLVVYPAELESDLYRLLGPYTNNDWANKNAYKFAEKQVEEAVSDEQKFYALFNRGDALVDLNDYAGGAASFDEAFTCYNSIGVKRRPYRMIWYRTGPFLAYYYSGRYQDVIELANLAIASTKEPYLEEAYYWRAMANLALGRYADANNDIATCLDIHPGFGACETVKANNGF